MIGLLTEISSPPAADPGMHQVLWLDHRPIVLPLSCQQRLQKTLINMFGVIDVC
jgi:hypothetical protein